MERPFQIKQNQKLLSEVLLLNSIEPESNVNTGDHFKEECVSVELNDHVKHEKNLKELLEVTGNQPVEMQIKSEIPDQESCFKIDNEIYIKQELPAELDIKPDIVTKLEHQTMVEPAENETNIQLPTHLSNHTKAKSFICNMCDYRSSNKQKLVNHIRTHTGEKPFKCHVCDYRSTEKSTLNRHMRTHTGEKPFICNVCGHKYSQKNSLNQHMRTHTGEKPFVCNVCGYKSTQKGNLTNHMRIHSEEKSFKCTVCGFKSAVKAFLNMHMRFHIGEKPFACNVCERKFTQKSNLTKHIKTHTETFNYVMTVDVNLH